MDVLDCFLYPDGFGYYLKYKSLKLFYQYIIRAKKLWNELNIPLDKEFSVLDNYNESWFDLNIEVNRQELVNILNNKTVPTFCFYKITDKYKILTNKLNWESMTKNNIENETFDELLELSDNADNIILVWSAIDSYELLSKEKSKDRLRELGIEQEV